MNGINLGLYEKAIPNSLTMAEKLMEAKNAGFDYFEISIDETEEKLSRLAWSKQEKLELLKSAMDADIRVCTMCLSAHRKYSLGSERESLRGLEIMSRAIDFAADMGIRIIQMAGYDVYYEASNEQTQDLFLVNLKRCVEMAARKGVFLAFETMETEFMNTVQKSMFYVHALQSPYLQAFPDSGNLTSASILYGTDPFDDLRTAKGHLCAVHLKESAPGRYREVPYGTGHVNFDGIIRTAIELGVKMFTAEFWYTGNNEWRQELKTTRNFFAQKIEKCR